MQTHPENFQPKFISTPYNVQDNSYSGKENINISHGASSNDASQSAHYSSDGSFNYQLPLQVPNSFAVVPQIYSGQNAECPNSNAYSNQPYNNYQDYNTQQMLHLSQTNSFSSINHVISTHQNSHTSNQYGISMKLSQKTIQIPAQVNSHQNQENHDRHVHINSFFYQPSNDVLNYHIKCEKLSLQLLNNPSQMKENEFVFYYQQQINNQFYQITCKIASPDYLNKMLYDVELNQNVEQERLVFTSDQKDNLKLHLSRYLSCHLFN
ncbi:hypothetical protein RclHR1_02600008 [Rhizophagus clarus]|uniref:Uncharacterized protein n=1 Tax=Rhizophagus clarus TaxID=94130 RepID=A0A2Z6RDS8_9GLOM|nr:hypothetical protein RclHR1_02600008 [Rhizophagus clarus]GES82600.1 hypothetical protein GLOIN_2v1837419 [Rhizophagus clarus]